MEMDLWTYERQQWNNGCTALCGVDEAVTVPTVWQFKTRIKRWPTT